MPAAVGTRRASGETKRSGGRRRAATSRSPAGKRDGASVRKKETASKQATPPEPAEMMTAVPMNERLEIDKALVREQPPLATAEAVFEHFELSRRHGIDRESFNRYARCVREVHSIGYADRLACELLSSEGVSGREAQMDLMTSRLAQRIARLLADDEDLGVSDLARLASSAASLRRAVTQATKEGAKRAADDAPAEASSSKIRRAVRELYGVKLADDAAHGETDGASETD